MHKLQGWGFASLLSLGVSSSSVHCSFSYVFVYFEGRSQGSWTDKNSSFRFPRVPKCLCKCHEHSNINFFFLYFEAPSIPIFYCPSNSPCILFFNHWPAKIRHAHNGSFPGFLPSTWYSELYCFWTWMFYVAIMAACCLLMVSINLFVAIDHNFFLFS